MLCKWEFALSNSVIVIIVVYLIDSMDIYIRHYILSGLCKFLFKNTWNPKHICMQIVLFFSKNLQHKGSSLIYPLSSWRSSTLFDTILQIKILEEYLLAKPSIWGNSELKAWPRLHSPFQTHKVHWRRKKKCYLMSF